MIAQITAIISAIIAIVSLIVSIKVYFRDTPKLRVEIEDSEYDCFFGNVFLEGDEKPRESRISGVRIRIRNSSSANIEAQSIHLRIGNELYRAIPNNIECWRNVTFASNRADEERTSCNYCISYDTQGIHVPVTVKGFGFMEGYVLFYNFPARIEQTVRAQIIIQTAVGTVKKRIILKEYDETFEKQEWKEVEQYFKSIKKEDE